MSDYSNTCQLYLISAVNHHISIVRLVVHTKFIDYISGDTRLPNAAEQSWYGLNMQRSKWFDLFDVDDRIEAMRGIWGIIGYMMRDTTAESSPGSNDMSA